MAANVPNTTLSERTTRQYLCAPDYRLQTTAVLKHIIANTQNLLSMKLRQHPTKCKRTHANCFCVWEKCFSESRVLLKSIVFNKSDSRAKYKLSFFLVNKGTLTNSFYVFWKHDDVLTNEHIAVCIGTVSH